MKSHGLEIYLENLIRLSRLDLGYARPFAGTHDRLRLAYNEGVGHRHCRER